MPFVKPRPYAYVPEPEPEPEPPPATTPKAPRAPRPSPTQPRPKQLKRRITRRPGPTGRRRGDLRVPGAAATFPFIRGVEEIEQARGEITERYLESQVEPEVAPAPVTAAGAEPLVTPGTVEAILALPPNPTNIDWGARLKEAISQELGPDINDLIVERVRSHLPYLKDEVPWMDTLADIYATIATGNPGEVTAQWAGGPLPILAGKVWTAYGMQALMHIQKVPERILYLGDVYDIPFISLGGPEFGVVPIPPEVLAYEFLPEEEQAKWLETYERYEGLRTARQDRFEDFVTDEQGDIIWERVMGKFDLTPTEKMEELILGTYGITGLGFTFIWHPEREEEFMREVEENPDVPFWEHVGENEDIWAELIMGTLTDPAWFLPAQAQKVLFPAAILIEPVVENVMNLWSRSSVRQGLLGLSKRSKFMAYADDVADTFNTLSLRYDPEVHGPAFGAEGNEFFQTVLLDPDRFSDMLSNRQLQILREAANTLGEADLMNVAKLLKKYGALERVETRVGGVTERILRVKGDDPAFVGGWITRALEDLELRRLGITRRPRGAVRRAFEWVGRFLRENWLGPNIGYHTVNTVGDTGRMIAAGYTPDPFRTTAGRDIARYLGEEYGSVLPSEVARSLVADALDTGRPTATSQLPWPIGNERGLREVWNNIANRPMPDSLKNWTSGSSPFAWILRNVNYNKVVEKGLAFGEAMERSRRATLFLQAFEAMFEGELRPTIIEQMAQDPDVPRELLVAYRNRAIKNPADFDRLEALLTGRQRSAEYIHLERPPTVPPTDFMDGVENRLQELEQEYIGNLDNPLFRRELSTVFDQAEVIARAKFDDAVRAIMGATELPEDFFTRWKANNEVYRQTQGEGVIHHELGDLYTGEAIPAYLEQYPGSPGLFYDGRWYFGTGFHRTAAEAIADHLGVSPLEAVELNAVHFLNVSSPYLQYDWVDFILIDYRTMHPGVDPFQVSQYTQAARGLLDAGMDSSSAVLLEVPGEGFQIRTLQGLANIEVEVPEFPPSRWPPGEAPPNLKEAVMEGLAEAEGPSVRFDVKYTRTQLRKAAAGIQPDNAVLGWYFEGMDPDDMALIAEGFFVQGDEGLYNFWKEAVEYYNQEYYPYGGGISEAVPLDLETARPRPAGPAGVPTAPQTVPFYDTSQAPPSTTKSVQEIFDLATFKVVRGVYEPTGEVAFTQGVHDFASEAIGIQRTSKTLKLAFRDGEFVFEGNLTLRGDAARKLLELGVPSNTPVHIPGLQWGTTLGNLVELEDIQQVPVEELEAIERERVPSYGTEENPQETARDAIRQVIGIFTEEDGLTWSDEAITHAQLGPTNQVSWVIGQDGLIIAAAANDDLVIPYLRSLIESGVDEATPVKLYVPNQDPLSGALGDLANAEVTELDDSIHQELYEQALRDYRNMLMQQVRDTYQAEMTGLIDWRQMANQIADRNQATVSQSNEQIQRMKDSVLRWKNEHLEALDDASVFGASETHRVLFDYATKTNMEEIFHYYSPFTTWQLRNPLFWGQVFARKPGLLSFVYRAWHAMEQDRKRKALTDRFKGTVGFELDNEFLGFPAGYYAADIRGLIDMFGQFREPFEAPGTEPAEGFRQVLRNVVNAGKWIGIRPWPWIDLGLQYAEVMPREGVGELFGPVQRYGEAVGRATGALPPEGRTESSQWLYNYYTRRRIAEMEAEGLIDHQSALNALATQSGPEWEEASQFVTEQQTRLMFLSTALPFNIKYATPGEMRIREAREGELTPRAREALPFLETYGQVFQEPERAQAAAIYDRYETLLSGLTPGTREYSDLLGERQAELEAAGLVPETPFRALNLPEPYAGFPQPRGATEVTPLLSRLGELEQSDLMWELNNARPRADQFALPGGDIDWESYYERLDAFNDSVPEFSSQVGVPITAEEWQSYQDRFRSEVEIAYDIHRDRVDAAWDVYESIQPGGRDWPRAVGQYVIDEYQDAVEAGMPTNLAAKYAADKYREALARGLPYERAGEYLGDVTEAQNAEQYAAEVAVRMGYDSWQEIEEVAMRLRGTEFTGMFGEPDPQDRIFNYYYELTPPEQREVAQTLGKPDDLGFAAFIRNMSEEEQAAAADQIARRAEGAQPLSRMLGLVAMSTIQASMSDYFLPPDDLLTNQERADLDQLDRDWWTYNYEKEQGFEGTWTALMEKYHGDETSGEGLFWATINRYALSDAAFDDPILSAAMDRIARGVFDFTDDQYEETARYFLDNLDILVDWEKTDIMKDHPDWVDASALERNELRSFRISELEDLRAKYYNIPGGRYGTRDDWEKDNPEEWARLKPYLAYREALEVGRPHYLYFFVPWEYEKWFGSRDPNTVVDEARQISERLLAALGDIEQWENNLGEWTETMEELIGPDPEEVEQQVGSGSGGGTSGGGGGDEEGLPGLPPPLPPPPPPTGQVQEGLTPVARRFEPPPPKQSPERIAGMRGRVLEALVGDVDEERYANVQERFQYAERWIIPRWLEPGFSEDSVSRAIVEMELQPTADFSKLPFDLKNLVVDEGIAAGMQEDETVEAFEYWMNQYADIMQNWWRPQGEAAPWVPRPMTERDIL